MGTRGFLLGTPLFLLAGAVSSAFLAPKGAELGSTVYVQAERADARRLNPLLAGDYVSARLVDQLFEGLVRLDEHGTLVPALARSFEDSELAFLATVPERTLPDGAPASTSHMLELVTDALGSGKLRTLRSALLGTRLVPAEMAVIEHTLALENEKGAPEAVAVELEIRRPERLRFELSRVLPELSSELEAVLGAAVLSGHPSSAEIRVRSTHSPELVSRIQARLAEESTRDEITPVLEQHPVTRFFLRPNVRFHDGKPFTANDVRFSYEAAVDPRNASPIAAYFEPVEKFEVLDELTVEVTYKRLFAPALYAWDVIGIVPEHLLNQAALHAEPGASKPAGEFISLRESRFLRAPVGTGPFRFGEWKPDEFVRLERFDGYWGKKPEFRSLVLRTLPDEMAQELEFRAGSLDRYVAKPHQAARFRADPRYQTLYRDEGHYSYIGYNFRRPLFRDRRVRRALGMAIDIDDLVRFVMHGEARRTTGPYYVNSPYYDPSVPELPYDPAGAERLLAEAGFVKSASGIFQKDGRELRFELVTSAGNSEREAIATIAEDAWRRIGVAVDVELLDWAVLMEQRVYPGDFDALVLGWVGGDATADKYGIWHSSQGDPYELNFIGYSDPRADRLLEEIQRAYDPELQVRLARALHRLLAEEQPYTFLHARRETWVFDSRIHELRPNAQGKLELLPLKSAPSGEADFFLPFWSKAALPAPEP